MSFSFKFTLKPSAVSFFLSTYTWVKYTLYILALFVLAYALTMFAADDTAIRLKANITTTDHHNSIGVECRHYLLFFLNATGPLAIYAFTLDGYLYKLLLAVLAILSSMILRVFVGVHFYAAYNTPNYLALALLCWLIWLIVLAKEYPELAIKVGNAVADRLELLKITSSSATSSERTPTGGGRLAMIKGGPSSMIKSTMTMDTTSTTLSSKKVSLKRTRIVGSKMTLKTSKTAKHLTVSPRRGPRK